MRCLTYFFVTAALSVVAHAGVAERVDDSLSPIGSVDPVMVTPNVSTFDERDATHVEVQFGWVEYRLNTAKYVGKSARIYYVVPAAVTNLRSPQGLRVDWRGRRGFANGTARAGERVLVWSGTVSTARIEDALDLRMSLTLAEVQGPIRFESYFEIEVN